MVIISGSPSRCVVECKTRSKNCWKTVSEGKFGSEWWRENLRMEKVTIDVICCEIRCYIEKEVSTT